MWIKTCDGELVNSSHVMSIEEMSLHNDDDTVVAKMVGGAVVILEIFDSSEMLNKQKQLIDSLAIALGSRSLFDIREMKYVEEPEVVGVQ